MTLKGLTPIESRIWNLLSDGRFHIRNEVLACLQDELADSSNLKPHVARLRKKIPTGYSIVSYQNGGGKYGYQVFRSLSSSYDGRK